MFTDRSQLAADVLATRLATARVGIVAMGLSEIDPVRVADRVAELVRRPLYAAVVGYGAQSQGSHVSISLDIEKAVDWRSTPSLAGRILVFTQGEVSKLHSLGDLDKVDERNLSLHLLMWAKDNLAENIPQQLFWRALAEDSATFPLGLVEEFTKAVNDARSDLEAIPKNLWRLGLLRDSLIVQGKRDPVERLRRNRELLVEMGLMSEQSRKRLGVVMAQVPSAEREQLKQAIVLLKQFYRSHNRTALMDLEVATVEALLKAGRPLPKPSRQVPKPTQEGDTPRERGGEDLSPVLRGRRLNEEISREVVVGGPDEELELRQLGDTYEKHLREPEQSGTVQTPVDALGGRLVYLEPSAAEFRSLIRALCNSEAWGGSLESPHSNVKEAVWAASPEDVSPYNPDDPSQGVLGQCLFSLFRGFDRYLPPENTFSQSISALCQARRDLAPHIDLILWNPFVLFGGFSEARDALSRYLTAYAAILRLYRQNEALLHGRDDRALRLAGTELLRLDVVHVRTPEGWKAILTPLHPFHLWRYKEILDAVHSDSRPFTEEERAHLADILPDLPHLLHFVVFSPEVSNEYTVLPQAGSLELLPTYENHTNRYLGVDGLQFLPDILKRFVAEAPYARAQLRLGLVDMPDLTLALGAVAEFLRGSKTERVYVDAYCTRGQNAVADLARMDYENRDYQLADYLRSGQIVVQLHSVASIDKVATDFRAKPVHIAVLFDQAQYQMQNAPRARQLLVSPLVVSYEYDYSETFGRGSIAPSSEAEDGPFSDFHFLVERAAQLPAGQHLRLQYDPGSELGSADSLLEAGATRWLVIADRVLTAYNPQAAVPLSEKRFGQREVGVWAGASSRSVGQFVDLLRRFNLRPDLSAVSNRLRQFAHIAAGGVFSLPGPGVQAEVRERHQKGLLGTVLAAAWYTQKYPGALITSLDSGLAHIWLRERSGSNQRADLVGMRLDDQGGLIVEAIEVKTRLEDSEVRVERSDNGQPLLSGRAVAQLSATLSTLRPIFGGADPQPLFTPARRELLKYQVHREIFRPVHPMEWQRTWYYQLKDAFALPQPRLKVHCQGLVIHVCLEEGGYASAVNDTVNQIALVTLGTQELEGLVSSSAPTTEPPPTEGPSDDTGRSGYLGSHEFNPRVGEETPIRDEVSAAAEMPESTQRALIVDLARSFVRACQSYHVRVESCDPARAVSGPTVIRYYVRLAKGQRLDPLRNALEDIGREMKKSGLLVSVIPNSDEIALDIPRQSDIRVPLAQVLTRLPKVTSPEQMPIAIGVTPEGDNLIRNLGAMPHLLVGGTTGSGKTVLLYSLLSALLLTHPNPQTLRLLLSTSKPEDFTFFEGLPHLESGGVIWDAADAIKILQTKVKEAFDQRLEVLKAARCRDITEYNARHPQTPVPPYVVMVDEFADLADQLSGHRSEREEFYTNIRRIAQLGRSRGVHLVLCTQRPSADLVPTHIRTLMNARIALRVNDVTASRMILEESGAERLQLHGDLWFKEEGQLTRAQGFFTSTADLERTLSSLR